jgi:two-component system NtrC family sensor kinase
MPLSFIKMHSMRFKLIASLIAVSILIGLISLVIGVNLLYRSVLDEAHNRIRQDLNVARVIYDGRIDAMRLALDISATLPETVRAVSANDRAALEKMITGLSGELKPDFLGMTDTKGRVIARFGKSVSLSSNPTPVNPLVLKVITDHQSIGGTFCLDPAEILPENPELADKARITVHGGTNGKAIKALLVGAAVPVWAGNDLVGVIYGGYLLNRDTAIVDKIGETVFKNEIYKKPECGHGHDLFLQFPGGHQRHRHVGQPSPGHGGISGSDTARP